MNVSFEMRKCLHIFRIRDICRSTPLRLIPLMKHFTRDKLGALYLDAAAPIEIKQIYQLSTAKKPIMLVLAPGAGEPLRRLLKLAEKRVGQFLGLATVHTNIEDALVLMSPSNISVPKIRAAMTSGRWVLIQNCHICSKQALNVLEALFDEVRMSLSRSVDRRSFQLASSDNIRDTFRLWLTIYVNEIEFPASLLQKSFKVTMEPSLGIRNQLLRNYRTGLAGSVHDKLSSVGSRSHLFHYEP